MTFLLDENFPKKSVELLQRYNSKVTDIRGSRNEGLVDQKIFELAKKSQAIFLTTDKDFYHTIHFTSQPHYGIVVIALSQPNSRKIIEKLDWFLKKFPDEEVINKCFLITDSKCKIYS